MSRIVFQPALPVVRSAPNRTDIACFIGFVSVRPGAVIPANVATWLDQQSMLKGDAALKLQDLLSGKAPISVKDVSVHDLPIPIDDWAVFDRLFAWNQRTSNPDDGAAYLGCAVRSFFGQGGRKCYIISLGPSFPAGTPRTRQKEEDPPSRDDLLAKLVPGYASAKDRVHTSPTDRANWSGVGHLFGLPDVSFVCLPDLPDLVCDPPAAKVMITPPLAPEEHFVECSTPRAKHEEVPAPVLAPRADGQGYIRWRKALDSLQDLVLEDPLIHEMQLIAAVPIPHEDTDAALDILAYLSLPDPVRSADAHKEAQPQQFLQFSTAEPAPRTGAFLQLAYPWIRTNGSVTQAEGLEPPDGALAGVLARNALTRGTFNNGTKVLVSDIFDIYPPLRSSETETPGLPAPGETGAPAGRTLVQRASLFSPTTHGISLISDVTVHPDETYRPARVNRLVAAIVRAARALGEDQVFEGNDARTWALLKFHLQELMTSLWRGGALEGDSPAKAFQVTCDRSTMTQNDLDNGRMIATINFTPAASIETITVLLSISAGDTGAVPLVAVSGAEVA